MSSCQKLEKYMYINKSDLKTLNLCSACCLKSTVAEASAPAEREEPSLKAPCGGNQNLVPSVA